MDDIKAGLKKKRTKYGEIQRNHMTIKQCPQYNHCFCKREVEDVSYQREEDKWAPIAYGMDITKAGKIFCCVCCNRHNPPTPPRSASRHQMGRRAPDGTWQNSPDTMTAFGVESAQSVRPDRYAATISKQHVVSGFTTFTRQHSVPTTIATIIAAKSTRTVKYGRGNGSRNTSVCADPDGSNTCIN